MSLIPSDQERAESYEELLTHSAEWDKGLREHLKSVEATRDTLARELKTSNQRLLEVSESLTRASDEIDRMRAEWNTLEERLAESASAIQIMRVSVELCRQAKYDAQEEKHNALSEVARLKEALKEAQCPTPLKT